MQGLALVPTVPHDSDNTSIITPSHHQMSLTACLEALETLGTLSGDVRGTATCLELRLGALEAAAALVIGVLTTLTAGGRGRTLQRGEM